MQVKPSKQEIFLPKTRDTEKRLMEHIHLCFFSKLRLVLTYPDDISSLSKISVRQVKITILIYQLNRSPCIYNVTMVVRVYIFAQCSYVS